MWVGEAYNSPIRIGVLAPITTLIVVFSGLDAIGVSGDTVGNDLVVRYQTGTVRKEDGPCCLLPSFIYCAIFLGCPEVHPDSPIF
jgi:hypothetical protein